jgi:hypothetical protein
MLTLHLREEETENGSFREDPRWAAITEITTSIGFFKAPRLSQLLLYLATQTLSGRGAEVTEVELATAVFGRGEDFDPASDTIVRSHMLRLRQRLAQVDAKDKGFLISLPKGQYALSFEELAEPQTFPSESLPSLLPATPVEVSPEPAKVPSHRLLYILLAALLVIVTADLIWHLRARPPVIANSPLWDQLFVPDKTTTFIAADSSLVLLHHYMQHEPSLAEYTSGRFRQEAEALYRSGVEPSGLYERRYTSIADLRMTQLLGEIAGERHIRMRATFARDMTLDDLKQNNVVLSGSRGANPWLELFEPQLNFLIENDPERHITVVRNRHPRNGEPAEYLSNLPSSPATYGVLAFIKGVEPSRNALILEGTSVAGTESIYDLLSNEEELDMLVNQFKAPDGSLMHFEVLLSSQYLNGSASTFHVVASRSYP